jgi:hypothetical protein
VDSFLEYLEKNCPGDDAHNGLGDPRPLLERCGACEELYQEHRKGILEERENCARIADNEPALEGPMPPENVEAVYLVGLETAFRSTVSLTKRLIADKIRAQGRVASLQDPSLPESPA